MNKVSTMSVIKCSCGNSLVSVEAICEQCDRPVTSTLKPEGEQISGEDDPLADIGSLQSRRAFVEQWRNTLNGRGHDMIANRNTIRRFVRIVDALTSPQVPSGYLVKDYADGWYFEDDEKALSECRREGHAIKPLYTHPASSEQISGEAVERAADVLWPLADWDGLRSNAVDAARAALSAAIGGRP